MAEGPCAPGCCSRGWEGSWVWVQGEGFPWGLPAGVKHTHSHRLVALLQVMEELQATSVHSDERELLQLLSTPHLRVVMLRALPTHTAWVS